MQIKKDVNGYIYTEFMNHLFKCCDVISINKYCDYHEKSRNKKIQILLLLEKCSVQDVLNNFSNSYVQELCQKYENNELLFDKDYHNKYENNKRDALEESVRKFIRKKYIEGIVYWIIYNEVTNQWLDKYKKSIICQKENFCEDGTLQETTYFIKLTKELREDILNRNSIYSWCGPLSVDDISFFNNGNCWLDSVAHEELCFIYCKDEEEYEYLKSIGIEFVEDKFVPVSRNELYYVDYKQKD